jgi:uncharacterized protein (TIGR02001 family)
MKNVVLSAVAVSAAFIAAPVFAADMPVKAKPVVAAPAPSQWDVLFGVAFTSDYILRGVSQSAHKPAVQGYTELDFKPADWLTLYTGVWGSSLYSSFANAEFDITAGARFSWGNFGLDVGVVNYQYPDSTANGFGDYTEFYAKPSYKFADWLTVGAIVDGGNDFNNKYNIAGPWLGNGNAGYYSANAVITLPWHPVADVNLSINPEIGHQWYGSGPNTTLGVQSYTYWDVGFDINYKVLTLDLRYWDTNTSGSVASGGNAVCFVGGAGNAGKDACEGKFVAMLKLDTALSAIK